MMMTMMMMKMMMTIMMMMFQVADGKELLEVLVKDLKLSKLQSLKVAILLLHVVFIHLNLQLFFSLLIQPSPRMNYFAIKELSSMPGICFQTRFSLDCSVLHDL